MPVKYHSPPVVVFECELLVLAVTISSHYNTYQEQAPAEIHYDTYCSLFQRGCN